MANTNLPGGELIEQGLSDLADGSETVESLLVSMAAPRLRDLGYDVPAGFDDPDLRLYRILADRYGDGAHSRYNALVRRVASFQRAPSCAR